MDREFHRLLPGLLLFCLVFGWTVLSGAQDEDPPAAKSAIEAALKINPSYVPAHLVLAELALDNRERDEARASIEKALAINPNSLEARSLDAAIASDCRGVVQELQEWGYIGEAEVVDPTWIDVAYTWSLPGSDWKRRAMRQLQEHEIHPLGRYGRWIFQGIADSIRDGFAAGAASTTSMRPHRPVPSLASMTTQWGSAAVGSDTLPGVMKPVGVCTWIWAPGARVWLTPPMGRSGTGHTTWIEALPRDRKLSDWSALPLLVIITGIGFSDMCSRPLNLTPASSAWQLMRSLYALDSPLPPLPAS